MAFILGFGTSAWGLLTYHSLSRRRALPVHAVAAVSFAVVVVLRVRNDYGALVTAAYVEPPLFLGAVGGALAGGGVGRWSALLRLRRRLRGERPRL